MGKYFVRFCLCVCVCARARARVHVESCTCHLGKTNKQRKHLTGLRKSDLAPVLKSCREPATLPFLFVNSSPACRHKSVIANILLRIESIDNLVINQQVTRQCKKQYRRTYLFHAKDSGAGYVCACKRVLAQAYRLVHICAVGRVLEFERFVVYLFICVRLHLLLAWALASTLACFSFSTFLVSGWPFCEST
jgi:hypothetical protein